MTNSSLIAEFYALVLLLILALFFYDVNPMRGYVRRRRVFAWSMVLCGVSIIVHIFCESIEETAAFSSPILVLALTTCYFLTTWLMLTLLSYYVLLRLYEFVYDEQKLNRAAYSAVGIFVVSAALLMLNIPSGALFYIDDVSLAYCTGPLNALSYLTPVGDIVLVLVCALINPTIREKITSIVEGSGISPEQIRLEVTERDVEHAGDAPVSAMQTLMDKGYLFMLDDFGIGYSNISRILDLPFDCIKLDRSLVVQMKKDERRWVVIKDYLVPLLHQMGRYVVAEGVETKEQLELVLGCNINRVQGFYFARPMPERELIRFLGTQGTPLQTPSGDE